MNEEEIKKELREAFGLGEDWARIEKKTNEEKTNEEKTNEEKTNEEKIEYWEIKASETAKRKAGEEKGGEYPKETGRIKKFSTEIFKKYNIVFRDWTFECEIEGEKVFEKSIAFFNCYGGEQFSFKGVKFLEDIAFCGVQFQSSFEDCEFHDVIFEGKFDVASLKEGKKSGENEGLSCLFCKSKFLGESIFKDLTIQYPVDFSDTEIKKMAFHNVVFEQKIEFSKSQIGYIGFCGVEFKEQVSFINVEIKNIESKKDLKSFEFLANSRTPPKNTTFSKMCLFEKSEIGNLEFGDGVEFEDVVLRDIGKHGEKLNLKFENIKINGKFILNDSFVPKKINLLSFEGVEFGGEVYFTGINVAEFKLKDKWSFNEERKAAEGIFSGKGEPSILHNKCSFMEVKIDKADFSRTHFQGKISFYEVTFYQSVSFVDTIFDKDISFSSITFPQQQDGSSDSESFTNFYGTIFKDNVEFGKQVLYNCSFDSASFKHKTEFRETKFEGLCLFVETSFDWVIFNQVDFLKQNNEAGKKGVEDEEVAYFNKCKFGVLVFFGLRFKQFKLLNSVIQEKIQFFKNSEVPLQVKVDFSGTTFEEELDKIDFCNVVLISPKFCSCTFKKPFYFENFKCEGEVDFSNAVFEDEVIFGVGRGEE